MRGSLPRRSPLARSTVFPAFPCTARTYGSHSLPQALVMAPQGMPCSHDTLSSCYKAAWRALVARADCAARIDLLSSCRLPAQDRGLGRRSGNPGLAGLSAPCLLAGGSASIRRRAGLGLIPHSADDTMDLACHCHYSQLHSTADKKATPLSTEQADIFLPNFRERALTGVLSAGFAMSHSDRISGKEKAPTTP